MREEEEEFSAYISHVIDYVCAQLGLLLLMISELCINIFHIYDDYAHEIARDQNKSGGKKKIL